MSSRSLSVLLCLCALCGVVVNGADWKYEEKDQWNEQFETCDGQKQTPINIVTADTVYDAALDDSLTFSDAFGDPIDAASVENNGYTLQFTMVDPTGNGRVISGANLPYNDYTFWQFHFHWGTSQNGGSEHTVNGEFFWSELHFVFKRPTANVTDPDSLAVLGFFISITDSEHGGPVGDLFDKFAAELVEAGETGWMNNSLSLRDLIPVYQPDKINKFYRYQGGLTTPGCYEVVNWFVFEDPIYISQAQYDTFLATKASATATISNNFRPVQPVFDRVVYRTRLASHSALTSLASSTSLLLAVSVTALLQL